MDEEIWKPVVGFEGMYEVSNKGRVKRVERTKEYYSATTCKPFLRYFHEMILCFQCEYKDKFFVNLQKNGKPTHRYIHTLVAEAFIPNLVNGKRVKHIDGDTTNNCVENLMWAKPCR